MRLPQIKEVNKNGINRKGSFSSNLVLCCSKGGFNRADTACHTNSNKKNNSTFFFSAGIPFLNAPHKPVAIKTPVNMLVKAGEK